MKSSSFESSCPSLAPNTEAKVRPTIPGPMREPTKGLSVFRRLKQLRQAYSAETFEQLIAEQRIGRFQFFILNDPDAIRHVLVENAQSYGKSPFLRRFLEPALGQGLVTSDGEHWQRHRRLLAAPFAPRNLNHLVPVIADTTSQFLARWEKYPDGTILDIAGEMSKLTLTSIARTMFAADDESILQNIAKIVAKYQDVVGFGIADFLGLPNWVPRLSSIRGRNVVRHLDEVVDQLIKQDRGADDLLMNVLIGDMQKKSAPLSKKEIRDEIVTILTVGHETTAQALMWTWYLVSTHPDVERKLMTELSAVLDGRAPTFDDLDALEYTKAIIQESMRLFPPAPTFSRQCLSDDVILGRQIPKGTVVMIAPWVLHRHRRLWDNPELFDPERFYRVKERPRAYLPFGAGPRICIGAGFAMMEAVIMLAQVAQRYQLKLAPGHLVVPVARIALRSQHGMKMSVHRRLSSC